MNAAVEEGIAVKRAKRRAYYLANKEKQLAQHREWYLKNKCKHQAQTKKWKKENAEKVSARRSELYRQRAEKHVEDSRRKRKENPEAFMWGYIRRTYGVTRSAYEAMHVAQGGRCAICGLECKTNRRLSVDHCHGTGRVRGLLCQRCNSAMGLMDDSADMLEKAAAYIRGIQ